MPSAGYSSIRSATSSWLPTSAVPGAAADQAEPGPQVRVDHQPGRRADPPCSASIRCWPDRLARASACCALATRPGRGRVEQPLGLRPRLRGGVPGDHVQPDAEPQRAALAPRPAADPGQLLRHLRRRLAPGQVDVGVPGGDRPRGRRGAAEVDRRQRVGRRAARSRRSTLVVLAVRSRTARPRHAPRTTCQELAGPGVALVVGEVVAEPALLVGSAAGDHVQQQPAAGDPLVGRGHLRGQRRRHEAGPERDQELQPLGLPDQRGGGQPGVLAPGAGRGEHASKPELLGGPGDLAEVVDARRAAWRPARRWPGPRRAGSTGRPIGMLCPRPMIARPSPEVGRNQWKVRLMTSPSAVLLNVVTTKFARSTLAGIRPAVWYASAMCCSDATTAGVIGIGRGRGVLGRGLHDAVRQAGALRPDLGPGVRVGVGPHVRLVDELQVGLDGGGLGRVGQRGLGRHLERVRRAVALPGDQDPGPLGHRRLGERGPDVPGVHRAG